MINDKNQLGVSHAAKHNPSFSVLSRLSRIEFFKDPGRPGNRSEFFDNKIECFGFVDFACHDQDRVVRLIKLPVEGLKTFNRNIFNVGTGPDGGVAVVVPEICGR